VALVPRRYTEVIPAIAVVSTETTTESPALPADAGPTCIAPDTGWGDRDDRHNAIRVAAKAVRRSLGAVSVPDYLWRFPTSAAIASLAERFGFTYHQSMQDWEWQVADEHRIGEFVDAYTCGELSENERFILMETILQSSENTRLPMDEQERWSEIVQLLTQNAKLHAYSIYYWSCVGNETDDEVWRVSPYLRRIMVDVPDAFAPSV
jgi:hypothetical protein